MITAQELRIGNLFYDRGGKILVLDYWDSNNKMCMSYDPYHPLTEYPEYAEPIPLTEQWLIDFGFNYDYITANLKDFNVGNYADGFYFIPTNKIDFRIGQELKHVHQLQNLFYSLTGKELIKK